MFYAAIIALLLVAASQVYGQTASRAMPTDVSAFMAYLWIGLWAALAGLVSFYQKVKSGVTRWFNIGELIGELGTSAFVGVVTGLICEAANVPAGLTYALVAITGHAGGRAIFWLERVLQRFVESKLGITTDVEIHKDKE